MTLEDLPPTARDPTEQFLLAIADDEFVTGHRFSEWTTIGPTLEEDNVLASIAQDELGHARMWYELLADDERTLDDLGFNRSPAGRHNTVLVEQHHDDFADTVAINFLYDEAERRYLEALRDGSIREVSARAERALGEEGFHREHADRWLDRLVATEEATERLQRALRNGLELSADLFAFEPAVADPLAEEGVLARPIEDLRADWEATVRDRLAELPVDVDDALDAATEPPATNGRAGEHTDDLAEIVETIHPEEVAGDHPVVGFEP